MNTTVSHRSAYDKELVRLYELTGETSIFPTLGEKTYTINGKKRSMNAKQYTQFCEIRGNAAYSAIKMVMSSPSYKSMNPEQKTIAIFEAVKKANDVSKAQMFEILGWVE